RATEDAFAFESPAVRQEKHRAAMKTRRWRLACSRPEHLQQRPHQRPAIALVFRPGKARRMNPGLATEARHLEPRIVGERRQSAQPPPGVGLLAGVLE